MDGKQERYSSGGEGVNFNSYYLGNPNAEKKILLVGNSITWHEPNPAIGWDGDWGMAASAPEKDYAHRLYDLLVESGEDVLLRVSRCKKWELNMDEPNVLHRFDDERAFDADVVVFRLGENVPLAQAPIFKDALRAFVKHICPRGKVLYTTCFWVNPTLDPIIKEVADERGEKWVNCGFSGDPKMKALGQFAHQGVAAHPNDAGMFAIAQSIFQGLQEYKAK